MAPRLVEQPGRLLLDAGRLLFSAPRALWPGSAVAALIAMSLAGRNALLGFALQTVSDSWLLALICLVAAEQAAGGRIGFTPAVSHLRGRLAILAAAGLVVRLVTDALTPLGVGIALSAGWSLCLPVIAVEGSAARPALDASWSATRRSLCRIAAVRLVALLLGALATQAGAWALSPLLGQPLARLGAQTVLGPFPLAVQALIYVEGRSAHPAMRDFRASIASMGVGSMPQARAR